HVVLAVEYDDCRAENQPPAQGPSVLDMGDVKQSKSAKSPVAGTPVSAPEAGSQSGVSNDDVAVFRTIMEGTARSTGAEFFQSLVRHMAAALNVNHAFIAQFVGESRNRVRTLAFWSNGRIIENVEWDLGGTPCEDVVGGKFCHHPQRVYQLFPEDRPLVEMGIESYLGVPLLDNTGKTLGHLAVFDEKTMPPDSRQV